MSARSVMIRGRRAAEVLMVDVCTIRHEVGVVIDPETGAETPEYEQVYSGPCRVQHRGFGVESPNSGQQRVDLASSELQLPVDVTDVVVNDVVTIDESVDPGLAGLEFRVKAPRAHTHSTKKSFTVEVRVS